MVITRIITLKHLCVVAALLLLVACEKPKDEAPGKQEVAITPSDSYELDQEQEDIYNFLAAEIAWDRQDLDTAMESYQTLSQQSNDPVIAARATSLALQREDYEAAGQSAKIWADATKDDPETQGITISILLKTSKPLQAMPYLNRLVTDDDEETFKNLFFIKSTLEDQRDYENYMDLLTKHAQQNDDYRSWFMVATTAHDVSDFNRALKAAEQSHQLKKDWIRSVALQVQILYENGQKDKAIELLQQSAPDFPNNTALKWLEAQMLLETGEEGKGMQLLQNLQNDPVYGEDATLELTRLALQKRDYKEANRLLNGYLAKNPQSDEALYYAGFVAQETGQTNRALELYRQVKQGPYFVNTNIQVAFIYSARGQTDSAIELMQALLPLYPEEKSRIELVKTQLLLDANRIEEAYTELSRILEYNRTDTELRYIRGLIALELGKQEQAETDFRSVIAQEPSHLAALNDLSTLLIEQSNYTEAKFYADQALKLDPESAQALDNLGWIQYKQGDTTAALATLEKAHALNNEGEIAAHLGIIYWEQGEESKAISIWNASLETNPNNLLLIDTMKSHMVYPAQRP